MVSIKKIICISYARAADGRAFITAEIIADTVSELPDINAFASYILVQGSVTQVMETGEFYIMDSSGNWCKKSESYTKDELDRLLAQKISTVPGKGLISDAERLRLLSLENYNDNELKSQTALNRSTLGYQRKNLLKNTAASQTKNGVTFTVNADGSVTVSGTASAGAALSIGQAEVENGRTYAISGCPAGGASTSYRLDARYFKNGAVTTISGSVDIGDGSVVTLPEDADDNRLFIYLRVGEHTNADGLTFYPMLRYAEITDNTYEPYKPSVEEYISGLEARIKALEEGGE